MSISRQLELAEAGFRIFPCAGKTPVTPHGCKDASGDPQQIQRWVDQYPHATWGVATNGLLVIDVDGKNNPWPIDETKQLDLAACPVSITPKGKHYFTRLPPGIEVGNSVGKLAPKVDIRTDGGYVIVAPSPGYSWADGEPPRRDELPVTPAWIVDTLRRPARVAATASGDGDPIPEGQRNSTLTSLAGTMRRRSMTEPAIKAALKEENVNRCRPPLPAEDVERIAESIAKYPPAEVDQYLASLEAQEELPPGDIIDDPGPLPASLLSVPGFIDDVVRYNLEGAFKPQPVLALAAALTLLATLTGRKVRDSRDTRTNMYVLGVAGTSTGKERARHVNKNLLYDAGVDRLLGSESIGSSQGLVYAVEHQPSILFQLDEFGRYLKSMSNSGEPHLYSILSVLLRMFTSSSSIYISDAVVDPTRVKRIINPNACIYGTTTPEVLYNALTYDSISDGFLSRVLVFEGDNEAASQQAKIVQAPEKLLQQVRFWHDFKPGGNLTQVTPQPLIVEASGTALLILNELEQFASQEHRRLGEPLGSLWPRAVEKSNKLALLYACSENAVSPHISDAAATWATEVVSHLTRKLVFLAQRWLSENSNERGIKRIARMIEDAGASGITKTQLIHRSKWLTRRDRNEHLETLIESGGIVVQQVETTGRPKNVYVHRRHAPSLAA